MSQDPKHVSDIPVDDDDILELTTLVAKKPGSAAHRAADSPGDDFPKMDGGDDFGADLDALLSSLTDGAPGAKATVAPPAPAASFASEVNPNEEMPMPETADIDSLLAELGVAPTSEVPPAVSPAAPEASSHVTKDDFDSILAMAEAASATMPAETSAPAAPLPAMDEDLPAMPESDVLAAPKRAPTVSVSSVVVGPAVATPAAASAPALPDDPDNLDLNELDALIDTIVATAPEMKAPAAPAPAVPAAPAASIDASALTARIDALEEALQTLQDTVPPPALTGEEASALVDEKLAALQPAVPELSEDRVNALMDARLTACVEAGSPFMEKIVAAVAEAVLARITEGGAASPVAAALRQDMEKLTASAAAKVIREEIAALLQVESGQG